MSLSSKSFVKMINMDRVLGGDEDPVNIAECLQEKAIKCIRIAQAMLPDATGAEIEKQAADLMHLTDAAVEAALKRILNPGIFKVLEGSTGIQGFSGTTGMMGTEGEAGVTGMMGTEGESGVTGVAGTIGVSGFISASDVMLPMDEFSYFNDGMDIGNLKDPSDKNSYIKNMTDDERMNVLSKMWKDEPTFVFDTLNDTGVIMKTNKTGDHMGINKGPVGLHMGTIRPASPPPPIPSWPEPDVTRVYRSKPKPPEGHTEGLFIKKEGLFNKIMTALFGKKDPEINKKLIRGEEAHYKK